MYKVFIYNKPIYFIDDNEIKEKDISHETYLCENENDRKRILSIHLASNATRPIFVRHQNIKKLMKVFFGDYKKVKAAGGVVLNKKEEILFIERLGYWDLPKGKVEKKEGLKIAAIREVEEECSISSPVIERKLLKTYHTYTIKNREYFKTTHWYLMAYEGNEELVPQQEEGITKVQWVNKEKMEEQVANTYSSIMDVLNSYLR